MNRNQRNDFDNLYAEIDNQKRPRNSLFGLIIGDLIENQKFSLLRSEERRVGKECRYRWSP